MIAIILVSVMILRNPFPIFGHFMDNVNGCEVQNIGSLIGPNHRPVIDSSPFLSVNITLDRPNVKVGGNIRITLNISNNSKEMIRTPDHDLMVLEMRDEDGTLAAETKEGCGVHFFSPCYGRTSSTIPLFIEEIAPGATMSFPSDAMPEYKVVKPGKYYVTGYVCGLQPHPDCIKTNTIRVAIQ